MGFLIANNPVLLPLDGGNNIPHFIVCITTEFFLENFIVNRQRTFYHVLHFSFADAILTFERNISTDFTGGRGVSCFSQFIIVEHTGDGSTPVVYQIHLVLRIVKCVYTYINR